ncbi:MAG: alkaline phosphatase family protein [Candidatus Nanohalobium sp.]
MNNQSILVVAFDGLDKELIDRYNCEHLKQQEYRSIDNKTNMSSIMTSELFASFITGENWKEHGVKGVTYPNSKPKKKLVNKLDNTKLAGLLPGYTRFIDALKELIGYRVEKYTKEDYEELTLFEVIEDSRAMFVPSYEPSLFWLADSDLVNPLDKGFTLDEVARHYEREFVYRKKQFFEEIESENRDLLMVHFHKPDIYQHLYEEDGKENEGKLEGMYAEIDSLAGQIKANSDYDYIIFMSDHGKPTQKEHNENAFYSSNKPLFNSKPLITDFYDAILDISAQENETEGIDL